MNLLKQQKIFLFSVGCTFEMIPEDGLVICAQRRVSRPEIMHWYQYIQWKECSLEPNVTDVRALSQSQSRKSKYADI